MAYPSKQVVALIGVGGVVLLTAVSVALHYRNRAEYFEQEYKAVAARLGLMEAAAREDDIPTTTGGRDRSHDSDRIVSRRDPEPRAGDPPEPVQTAEEARPQRVQGPDRGRGRGEDRMETLRTNDPGRYAEIQQRREAMQQTLQNAWTQATNFFMNRDTTRMTPEDREEYDAMMAMIKQAWALNQKLRSGLPDEMRQQVMSDLRSNVVAIAPLLEKERNREYFDAAVALGQSEQDAAAMVNYVNQINSNTTLRAILPGVRMGRGQGGSAGSHP